MHTVVESNSKGLKHKNNLKSFSNIKKYQSQNQINEPTSDFFSKCLH